MKQILLTILIGLGLTLTANAQYYDHRDNIKNMSSKKIERMDREHTKHEAKRRHFRTEKEFHHRSKYKSPRAYKKHTKYKHGYNYHRDRYRQRGFTQWKRGWTLAYRYDRASFYDNQGYYYGYFNHQGYYFEDVFYRYDRYYTYQDRIRGRGLFGHRYYMPENSRYYGFNLTRY